MSKARATSQEGNQTTVAKGTSQEGYQMTVAKGTSQDGYQTTVAKGTSQEGYHTTTGDQEGYSQQIVASGGNYDVADMITNTS